LGHFKSNSTRRNDMDTLAVGHDMTADEIEQLDA
jgi:hypothetical protein